MKVTAYMRVAKNPRGRKPAKFAVSQTPDQRPLESSPGTRGSQILPTALFALDLDIPDAAFTSAARVVAELRVPEEKLKIAAKVVEIEDDE